MVRSRETIIADILLIASEPARTSRIIAKANLGYEQFKSYTQMLQDKQLIRKVDQTVWLATRKGRDYLAAYAALNEVMQTGICHPKQCGGAC